MRLIDADAIKWEKLENMYGKTIYVLDRRFVNEEPTIDVEKTHVPNMTIEKIAYELYKQTWIGAHTYHTDRIDAMRDYSEYALTERKPIPFDEWIMETGYNGSCYASFNEFRNTEYLDKEYMRLLLQEKSLVALYNKDIKEKEKFMSR